MAGYDRGPFVDAFKILRTQVLRRLRKHDWNVLGVTSPGYGDGKTLTAVNLAVSIAMDSAQTVLLADSDLTHPSLHEVWDLNEDGPGLTDYLLYDKPVQDLLVHPGIARLVLLPGGRPVSNSTEFLTSPKMLALVEELKHRYPSRIIIFDLPPLLTTADAIAFAPSMDALLLVVEEGKTTADDVQRAFLLVKDSCPVLGTVLNKAGQLAASPASMKKALSF
jgi:capsular exopolysaccharide synthesis family protein